MTVAEFENAVWETEGIRIVIRAHWDEQVGDWPYEKAAKGNFSVAKWFRTRVERRLGDRKASVIDGYGHEPHWGQQLSRVRRSYAE